MANKRNLTLNGVKEQLRILFLLSGVNSKWWETYHDETTETGRKALNMLMHDIEEIYEFLLEVTPKAHTVRRRHILRSMRWYNQVRNRTSREPFKTAWTTRFCIYMCVSSLYNACQKDLPIEGGD